MDGLKNEGDVPAEMRREQMLAYVKTQDFVRVTDLSARFHVSEVTVRGDIDVLTEQGHIRRIRGGAMLCGEVESVHIDRYGSILPYLTNGNVRSK